MAARSNNLPYLLRITDWTFEYSFGLPWTDRQRDQLDPFWESNPIKVFGLLLVPIRLGEITCDIRLWPDPRLEIDKRDELTPSGVGGLSKADGQLKVGLHIPPSAFQPLIAALAAGKLQFLELEAPALRYHEAVVQRIWFWRQAHDERLESMDKEWRNSQTTSRPRRRR